MTAFGVQVSPRNVTAPTDEDWRDFFDKAQRIGNYVSLIVEWQTAPPLTAIAAIQTMARARGLGFHLTLSPISLLNGRTEPAIPAGLGSSFTEPAVRAAYLAQVQEYAALGPDVLGLATEINLLAPNAGEFAALASLIEEARAAVPTQVTLVSFQWDVMVQTQGWGPVFAVHPTVYGFTTFPAGVDPATIVPEYYGLVRTLLPTQPIAFTEVGYPAANRSEEARQADYYGRVPAWMAHAEWVTLALLHDIQVYGFWLDVVGVRYSSGRPKRANTVVEQWA